MSGVSLATLCRLFHRCAVDFGTTHIAGARALGRVDGEIERVFPFFFLLDSISDSFGFLHVCVRVEERQNGQYVSGHGFGKGAT